MWLYDPNGSPPPKRTSADDRPTLLITWWCCGCCLFIIFSRAVGRYARTMKVFTDDKWMIASALPLLARVGLIHVVLILGTNNVDIEGLTEHDVKRRVLGSQLVLASRVMYAMYIWSQKFCITEFYKRLTVLQFWGTGYDYGLKVIRWSLLVTFAAGVVSIFAECRPSQRLWQVEPDPGPQCRQSFVPLIILGSLNVITDLSLVIFPAVAIFRSGMRTRTKLYSIFLYSLSLLPVATTLYRIPSIIQLQSHYGQPYRTLWASLEGLAACVCANAVVLNSYARDKGPKKKKFRIPSPGEDAMDRRSVRLGTRLWGSDEDLARDVGMGMDPELLSLTERSNRSSGVPSSIVRFKTPYYFDDNTPALPTYDLNRGQLLSIPAPAPAMPRAKWGFDGGTLHSALKRTKTQSPESPSIPERAHEQGRIVSFSDVGGLLREDESPGGGRRQSGESERVNGSGSGGYDRGGEIAPDEIIFNDVGGLLRTVFEGDMEV